MSLASAWSAPTAADSTGWFDSGDAPESAPGLRTTQRVLLVVPTLNEAAHIGRVLTTLLDDLPATAETRVVVVDGGSSDETVSVVSALATRNPALSLLHNEARIQSAAVNLAARRLGHGADVLIRCDAHAGYPPGYCEGLLRTLAEQDADAVVVPLDSTGEGALQRAVAWVSNSPIGTGGSAHRAGRSSGFVDHGHHAAFRMKSFCLSGGYDETFTHNEDAELDCRQRALGARIFLDSDLRVSYQPRSSFRALWRQYFKYGFGRSRTVRRHPESLRLRQLVVPLNLVLLVTSLVSSPWEPVMLAFPLLYLLALTACSLYFALVRRSAAGLLTGAAAAVMHTAWGAGFLLGMLTRRESPWQRHENEPLWPERDSEQRIVLGHRRLHAMLVDPSLFTGPYDAALSRGLVAANVRPIWAVRPVRRGDQPDLDEQHVDAFFYRRVDQALGLPGPLRAAAKGFAHLSGLLALVRRVFTTKPDVVHFQWLVLPAFDALAIAVIGRRCPVLVTVHDTVAFNGDRQSLLQSLGVDAALRLAHRLIVHTRGGEDTLLRRGLPRSKVRVIPHGPLALTATPTPAALAPARDPRWTFVLFGEIKRYKGVDILVEAVALLPKELRARARFIVAGRARMDLSPTLARITELGLDDDFEVRPRRLSEEEMAELFESADCFVFPYRQVDASGVYFLVKPLGKWIIASEVGIFAEDLEPNTRGALIPAEQPQALAAALEAAIVNRPQPSGTDRDPSWVDIGRSTRELYVEARAAAGLVA